VSQKFDRNDMFITEIKDFIHSVKTGGPSPIPLEESFITVDVALRALSD